MVERTGWVKTEAQANSSSKSATTEVDPENVSRLTELITRYWLVVLASEWIILLCFLAAAGSVETKQQ